MVPKAAVAAALDKLAEVGIQPRFLEVGPPERSRLLPINDSSDGRNPLQHLVRGLAWVCACLAAGVLILPFLLQAFALHATDNAIEALQPNVAQFETLRRGMTADGAGREVLMQEMQRTGDVLQVLCDGHPGVAGRHLSHRFLAAQPASDDRRTIGLGATFDNRTVG